MEDIKNHIDGYMSAAMNMLNDSMEYLEPEAKKYLNDLLAKAAKGELEGGLTNQNVLKITNKVMELQGEKPKSK